MNDETGFLAAALKELLASTAVILAAWGALGGATNALTTKMRLRDAHGARHRLGDGARPGLRPGGVLLHQLEGGRRAVAGADRLVGGRCRARG